MTAHDNLLTLRRPRLPPNHSLSERRHLCVFLPRRRDRLLWRFPLRPRHRSRLHRLPRHRLRQERQRRHPRPILLQAPPRRLLLLALQPCRRLVYVSWKLEELCEKEMSFGRMQFTLSGEVPSGATSSSSSSSSSSTSEASDPSYLQSRLSNGKMQSR